MGIVRFRMGTLSELLAARGVKPKGFEETIWEIFVAK
jgi:hypothetical protein